MADDRNFQTDQSGPTYASVEPFAGMTTIPHHLAVETAEEGARNGRIVFGPLAAPEGS